MTHEEMRAAVESLRRQHRYVEDGYYSCPKAPDGCWDDTQGDECNCGADAHNATVDRVLAALGPEGESAMSRCPECGFHGGYHAESCTREDA